MDIVRERDKSCRFCLKSLSQFSVDIFREEENGLSLVDQIKDMLVVQFEDTTDLPRNGCLDCVDFLTQLRTFVKLAKTSTDTLSSGDGPEENSCRFCLKSLSEFSVNIFLDENGFKLVDQIKEILLIQCEDIPHWPRSACLDCVDFLTQMRKFVDLAVTSNDNLWIPNEAKEDTITLVSDGWQEAEDAQDESMALDEFTDVDLEYPSSRQEIDGAENIQWPIEDHQIFLEVEKKMQKDEAFAEVLRSFFEEMLNQDVCALFGHEIQKRYTLHGRDPKIKISESPLLCLVASSWINKDTPFDEVIEEINRSFKCMQKRAIIKMAVMKKTNNWNWNWPLEDHESFLEMEQTLQKDEKLREYLTVFFKKRIYQGVGLFFGNDIQKRYTYVKADGLIEISDSPLLMCAANSWTNQKTPLEVVLKELGGIFYRTRMAERERTKDGKNQVTATQVNQPTVKCPIILPEANENEQIPMKNESELGVDRAEAKKWEEDWPITDHVKFLEIQKKIEKDPQLRKALKLHLKSSPNRDLSVLFGKDVLRRYAWRSLRLLKLEDSTLFKCVAESWAGETTYCDMLKNMSSFMTFVRRNKSGSRQYDETSLKELITENTFYVCKICESDCGTFSLLKIHVQTEHKGEFDGYEICCKVSLKGQQTRFLDHLRLHLDKEAFKCQECGNCLTNSHSLKIHMEQIHTISTNFVCPTCGRGFNNPSFLNKHINRAHGRKYKCDHCNAELKNAESLKYHVWQLHENVVNFLCELCGKGFATRGFLNSHIADHGGPHGGRRKKKPKAPKADLKFYDKKYFEGK